MAHQSEYGYFAVLEEGHIPEAAIGDVVGLQVDFGDQFSMFGILAPCDSTGDLIDPSTRLVWRVGVEDTGEIVRISKEGEVVKTLPSEQVDINPDAKSEKDLAEDKPKMLRANGKRGG